MRLYVNLLLWLSLCQEVEGGTYNGMWETWLTPITTLLFKPISKVVIWDVLLLIALAATLKAGGARVPSVPKSIMLCGASVVGIWIWGTLRGGDGYQAVFQLHPFLISLVAAMVVANTYRTAADVVSLAKTLVFATVYRSIMCFAFYWQVAKDMDQPPIAMSDHCDTVLFVAGLFILIVNALERRTGKAIAYAVVCSIPIFMAIVVNNRRLAWLCVGLGFFLIYLMMPVGKPKRRITMLALAASPLLVAYIAIGWGNPTGIFKPVHSISTMFGEHQDMSSLMRDIENYNLLVTLRSSPILGVGFGSQYIEELRAIDISDIFAQYRYMPHNSLLGVIAFSGMLGFAGIWQMVVVTTYLHALVYRTSKHTVARIAALASLIAILVIELQMWGDLGFNHPAVCTQLAITVGLAARLPAIAKIWPPRPAVAPAAATTAEAVPAAAVS